MIDKLKAGARIWNEWRASCAPGAPDLSEANLEGANLTGCNLDRVRLDRASLFEADLTGATLDAASLWGTDLRCVNAHMLSAKGAVLREADVRAALFEDCDFGGADFRELRAQGSEFFECGFEGADLSDAGFREAVFSHCHFDSARMNRTDFGGARIWAPGGLGTVEHQGPSWLDPATAEGIEGVPPEFLRGVGWPERLVDHWSSIVSEGISFYSAFISYAHQDKTFAHRLHDALQRKGVRCWLDGHALLPGDDIKDQIDRGIRLWDKVVLCCSEAALTSWWVDQEIEKALQKEDRLWRERGEKVQALIPIRLDDYVFSGWASGKKSMVTSRYIGDFSQGVADEERFQEALDRLVLALSADPLARGIAPAPKL